MLSAPLRRFFPGPITSKLPTDRFGEAMRDFLSDKQQRTADRVLAIHALKNLKGNNDWRTDLLLNVLIGARTYQERFAAAEVLGELKDKAALETLTAEYKAMPLDSYCAERFCSWHGRCSRLIEGSPPRW